ncbi:anti-sigma factor [Arthrobacter sp. NPDC093128]|uniref:anti-sigma factor n=1 Tax=Arthrobacter sp. NPDC093128 TaxID=3154979 RepID=UPI00344868F1
MGQLRNLLRGLGGNCSRGFLPWGKRGRSAKHMESCPECASLLWRERQYLERMRRAAIPAASDDLTARLLARTQHLAMASASPAARPPVPASPAVKVLGLAAGGAVAAAGVVAGAAYFLAGDPRPVAAGVSAESFQQQAATFGLQSSDGVIPPGGAASPGSVSPDDVSPDTGSGSAGSGSVAPLGTAGMLTSAELQSLRARGWSCPELQAMGFHVLWARREAVSGQGVLELRLTDGKHFATVLEQHPQVRPADGLPSAAAASSPTNILTGRPAAEDGFVPAPESGVPAGGLLWINASAPWKAIYQASDVTFTYISDLPAEAADDGVAELIGSVSATAAPSLDRGPAGPGTDQVAAAAPEALPARLQRGLGRIMELFTP